MYRGSPQYVAWSFLTFGVLILGCDGHTVVSGVVVDENDRGIADAVVVLRYHRAQVRDAIDRDETDKDSRFEVGGTHAPGSEPLDLVVERDGFVSHRTELTPNEVHKNGRVHLKRKE